MTLQEMWKRQQIPIMIYDKENKKLIVRLPYAEDNMTWLRQGKRHKPQWNNRKKYWIIPMAWHDDLVREALTKYHEVVVVQKFNTAEKCAPACWNAMGMYCECSCMGKYHGMGYPGGQLYIVSETRAILYNKTRYTYRLLREKKCPLPPPPQ